MYHPVVTLFVMKRSKGEVDRLGNEIVSWEATESVNGCLFAPGAPQDLESQRPEGVKITATAHFPNGYSENLQGALISLDNKNWLEVIGNPMPYPKGTVPGKWSFMVLLGDVNG